MKTFQIQLFYIILAFLFIFPSFTVYGQNDSLIKKYHNENQKDTVKGAGYYFDAGTAKAQAGDCISAIDLYDKCIAIDPVTFDAYYNRAFCKMHLNDYEAAIADFTTVIRLNVRVYPNALYLRGSCFNELKRYDMAIADFTKALEVSSNPDIYAARGLAYMQKQDYQHAVIDYNNAIAKKPEKTELYGKRAICLYAIHHLKEAIEDADKFLSVFPASPEVVEAELRAKFELKDYTGALVCAQNFIKIQKSPIAYYYAGLMEFNMGKYQDGVKYFSSAVGVNSKYSDAYYSRGLCYFGLNDMANACADINKAKQLGFAGIDPKIEAYCNSQKQK